MGIFVDIKHDRFSRLFVVRRVPSDRCPKWLCKCDCGNECIVIGANLRKGNTKSCGCLQPEKMRMRASHGHARVGSESAEHKSWAGMRDRCLNPSNQAYADYGGRGIGICSRWDQFGLFLKDMGPMPGVGYSIDRYPNNDGNYEPGNCRWATSKQQNRNRRSNRIVELGGVGISLAEAAEIAGLPYARVYARLARGWSIERALGGSNGDF